MEDLKRKEVEKSEAKKEKEVKRVEREHKKKVREEKQLERERKKVVREEEQLKEVCCEQWQENQVKEELYSRERN